MSLQGSNLRGTWPVAHDEMLRENFRKGWSYAQSASAINRAFGTNYTRNSLIGRGNRLGLRVPKTIPPRPKPSVVPPKPKKAVTPAQRPDIAIRKERSARMTPAPFVPRLAEVNPQNVTLVDLAADGCRWPSGEGPYLFCNHPRLTGLSYCGPHHRLSHRHTEAA